MITATFAGTDAGLPRATRVRNLLLPSAPIAILALSAAAAGVFSDAVYAHETPHWAAQGAGQDVVNLLVYPIFLFTAWRAARGSLAAYLAWLGLLIYTTYSFALYAGFVHFGTMFPVYVATFGLSAYTLAANVRALDVARVARLFDARTPVRATGWFLLVIAALFALLEITAIVAAIRSGSAPAGARTTGLPVDPVHVLDLGLLLPAIAIAAIALLRRHPLGIVAAVPLLVHLSALGAAIGGMVLMTFARGLTPDVGMIALFAIITAVNITFALRFTRGLRFIRVLPDVLEPADAGVGRN